MCRKENKKWYGRACTGEGGRGREKGKNETPGGRVHEKKKGDLPTLDVQGGEGEEEAWRANLTSPNSQTRKEERLKQPVSPGD